MREDDKYRESTRLLKWSKISQVSPGGFVSVRTLRTSGGRQSWRFSQWSSTRVQDPGMD
jgi:hypothetical protein